MFFERIPRPVLSTTTPFMNQEELVRLSSFYITHWLNLFCCFSSLEIEIERLIRWESRVQGQLYIPKGMHGMCDVTRY